MKLSSSIGKGVRPLAALCLAFSALAVPVAQGGENNTSLFHQWRFTDPEATNVVSFHRWRFRDPEAVPLLTAQSARVAGVGPQTRSANYGPLDPIIANAVRESSRLDPIIANAVRESTQRATRRSAGRATAASSHVVATSRNTFNWRDAGIGAGVVCVVVALGALSLSAIRKRNALAHS
jgi:hypothetical protein